MTCYGNGILSSGYGIIPKAIFDDERLTSNARLIYACLASYGGGQSSNKKVWPSIATICKKCGIARHTVIKHLKVLEELGYIKVVKQVRNDGGNSNNLYILNDFTPGNCAEASAVDALGAVREKDNASAVDALGAVQSVHSNINNKTLTNNNNNKTYTASEAGKKSIAERFEKLWKLYPRKSRKKDAFNAYKRAIKKGVTDEEIKAGIENYNKQIKSQHTESQFIAQGGTWFNQERWNDEYATQSGSDLGEYSRGEEYEGLW